MHFLGFMVGLGLPGHFDVGDAIEDEWGRGLLEAYCFVESSGVFLRLDVDDGGTEVLFGGFNGVEHDLFAVAFPTLGGDDAAYRHARHVRAGWTHAAKRHHAVSHSEP